MHVLALLTSFRERSGKSAEREAIGLCRALTGHVPEDHSEALWRLQEELNASWGDDGRLSRFTDGLWEAELKLSDMPR